ncbi:hypothetical protein [Rubrobacter tropicus]|uniref:hypothetical protein n=1 Tax=Rubrobacter tropicus TaxID=2653851 RepID=UPI00140B859F|nr:hypothetical protein [Rubrobacter tropicus]
MGATKASPNVAGGRLWACLILTAFLLVPLMVAPRPSGAVVSSTGFPVSLNPENETQAAVSGNTAVWTVSRAGGPDIQGKNLSTGLDLLIPTEPGAQTRPSVSGRTVVWEDASSGNADIYGYDLVTRQKFPVAVGPGNQTRPSVSGRDVVWEDDRNGNRDIYRFDLDSGQESPVTTAPGDQRDPDVDGGLVVWEQRDAMNSDVVLKNLATGARRTVASGSAWQDSPAVSAAAVVWRVESASGDYDVRGYDLAGQRGIEVAVGSDDEYAPDIDGRTAVWTHNPGGNADVRGKDLSTGESFTVAQGSGQQEVPAASGETVVWEVQRDGDDGFGSFDLQGARLDLAPASPAGLAAMGSGEGVALDWEGNADSDLAGYNVYRAASEGGEYAKLNTRGPLSATSFDDAQAPKGTRSYYRVTAVDAAGSESAAARASAVVPKATQLTLSASPTLLNYTLPNSSTTLSGQLSSEGTPLAGKGIVLERKPLGGSAFVPVSGGELTTDAGGNFSLAGLKPERNTEYRARFVTDAEELQSSASPIAAVEVKLLVNTGLSATRVKLGKAVGISGSVFPANSGNVTLNIARNGLPLTKINVPLQSSRFSRLYRPPKTGLYTVRVTPAGYPQHLVTTTTRSFRVTIR